MAADRPAESTLWLRNIQTGNEMRSGRILCKWLLVWFATTTATLGQSNYPPSATFARPPGRALSGGDVLPDGWSYSRSLTMAQNSGSESIGNATGEAPHTFNLCEEDWWTVFRDPELDRLEGVALASNQDLELAVTRVMQSRLQARIVAADFFPHFDVTSGYSRSVTSDDSTILRNSVYGGNSSEIEKFLN